MWSWMVKIMANDDTPWAKYYVGSARYELNLDDAQLSLKESAEAGFAPAMTLYAIIIYFELPGESDFWMQKAANLNEPRALCQLSSISQDFRLLRRGAEQCHPNCIRMLLLCHERKLLITERVRYKAILALFQTEAYFDDEIDMREDLMFVAGRELFEYAFFWGTNDRHPHKSYMKCIDLYNKVTHRARRAALQTLVGLRRILGRDVSLIIAKIIYSQREEWVSSSCQ